MDQKTREYLTSVINLAQSLFRNVDHEIETTPERVILRLQAEYGQYRIFITELFSDELRKYRYYVLRDDWVEAGFDNSPDPRAIRLKYGRIGREHAGKQVPHLHLENKTRLLLTVDMTFLSFVEWVKNNL